MLCSLSYVRHQHDACRKRRDGRLAPAGGLAFALGTVVLGCSRTPLLTYEPPSNDPARAEAGFGGGSGGGATGEGSGAGGGGGGQPGSAGASGAPSSDFGDVCARTTNHLRGVRLWARTVVTEEGDQVWIGWHDVVLGLDCTFFETEGAEWRCLPDDTASARLRYVDGECSKPLLVVSGTSSGVHGPARVLEAHGCTRYYAHYARGPEVDVPSVLYQVDVFSGQCNALAAGSAERAFVVGAKMDLTQYVGGEVRQVTTHRLVTDAIVASDGTYQVVGVRDTSNGITCEFLPGGDGIERCWPGAALYQEGYYSDASCTDELLRGHECSSFGGLARVDGLGACPSASRVVAYGQPYRGKVYGAAESGQCTADSGLGLPPLFEPDAEVAADTFQATEVTTKQSDPGRLKPRYRTSDDGFCAFEGWWDSELSEPCRFLPLSDGVYRCLPGEVSRYVRRYFRDAGCTEETRLAEAPTCPERSDYTYVVVDQGLGPDGGREVYRVARRTRLSSLWEQTGDGTCTAVADRELAGAVEVGMPYVAEAFMAGISSVE
jgi:hypothetical protein